MDDPCLCSVVLQISYDNMMKELQGREAILNFNNDSVETDIEFGQSIGSGAPCWKTLRSELNAKPQAIYARLYSLMAPQLIAEDRSWVLPCFRQGAILAKEAGPWENTSFWIGMDWLLCYGEPADWKLFASVLNPRKGWSDALMALQGSLEKLPAYWKVSPHIQGMFCEGITEESFWKAPDVCLAEWGVTRQNLIHLSMDEVAEKHRSSIRFPTEAKERGYQTMMQIQVLIGPDGEVKATRPLPGHALVFFAPESLRFASSCTFKPAVVAGVMRPSRFIYHMFFRLPKRN